MPRLFQVVFITKDSRLGAALLALEGIAYGKPEITPIRGAEIKGNMVNALRVGSVRDSVAKMLTKRKGTEISRAELGEMMERVGGKAGSAGPLIAAFKERGLLKGKGSGKLGYKVL